MTSVHGEISGIEEAGVLSIVTIVAKDGPLMQSYRVGQTSDVVKAESYAVGERATVYFAEDGRLLGMSRISGRMHRHEVGLT